MKSWGEKCITATYGIVFFFFLVFAYGADILLCYIISAHGVQVGLGRFRLEWHRRRMHLLPNETRLSMFGRRGFWPVCFGSFTDGLDGMAG